MKQAGVRIFTVVIIVDVLYNQVISNHSLPGASQVEFQVGEVASSTSTSTST